MSEWPGFDQRKVCPQCGGYQTRFGKQEHAARSPYKWALLIVMLLTTLFLLILLIAIMLIKRVTPKPYQLIGLFFTVALGLRTLLIHYLNSRGQKNEVPVDPTGQNRPLTIYSLHCWDCGYQWEKTQEEWEQEGKEN